MEFSRFNRKENFIIIVSTLRNITTINTCNSAHTNDSTLPQE